MKTPLSALFLCITLSSAPSSANDARKNAGFLIDASKHYVYLKFDRVGHREPLSPEEPDKGLWLRLVNNCRIPIVVAIFDTGPDNSGVGVFDEVVPIVGGRPLPVFDAPGKTEKEPKAMPGPEERPNSYSLAEVFSTTTVSPGDNLLFNLPLNHVGPCWYIQVRFYFALPGEGYGTGPYSVVSFDWQDIPEMFREPGPASPMPTKR